MIADAYDSEKEFVSTDVSSKFDFNTFSIIKTVNCTYNNINTNYFPSTKINPWSLLPL